MFQTALAGGVSNISFSTLSTDLGRTMYRYSFRLPPYYTLLVRSLSVLEGIALASDPNYKVRNCQNVRTHSRGGVLAAAKQPHGRCVFVGLSVGF